MKLFGNVVKNDLRINIAQSPAIAKELGQKVVCQFSIRKRRPLIQNLLGDARCSHNVVLSATQNDCEYGIGSGLSWIPISELILASLLGLQTVLRRGNPEIGVQKE
jgi:hypothetical protein